MTDAILVTGATGFIGTHLVAAIRAQGRDVVPLSSRNGDIARSEIDHEGVGRVVHLAGKSYVPGSWSVPREYYETNVLGTVNVLEFCRRRRTPLTYVSSYVYGVPQRLPIDETHPLQPTNPYSHSKIVAEDVVAYYAAQFGVRTTVVRPFNVYGPGQDKRFVVPTVVRQALDPRIDRIVVTDERPKRDFLFIGDLVSLLIATLSTEARGAYNAGSGTSTSIGTLVDEVNALLPVPKPLESMHHERPAELFDVVADISRARRELEWQPQVSLRDGVRRTVEWAESRVGA
jgi:nucleoside-diphosphate-sugar epimerase